MSLFSNDPGLGGLFTNDPNRGGGGGSSLFLPWVAGEDFSIYDERVYDFKLFLCVKRVNDGRTTTPDVDTEYWRQTGRLQNLPDAPAATTTTTKYVLEREGAEQETGVTIAFGANATATFDSSYIGGFPANISNFNNGRVIEFANGLANAAHVSGNLSIGNVGGARVSIASSNDNDTLVMKVAEWVNLLNASVNMNLRFAVNLAVNTSMDIFFIDTSINIDPANIVVRTTSDTGIVLGNDFSASINASAPSIILEAPAPTWVEDTGGGGEPDAYLKSAVVSNAGATLTLTNKDNTTVGFTPSSGGGSGYTNNLLGAGSLLTKVALFLGTAGTEVTNANPLLTYIPYTTNSVIYYWFPNRDSGNGQWSDNTNPVAMSAVTINLIG